MTNVGLQRRYTNSKKMATWYAGIRPNNLCRQQRNLPEATKVVYQKIKRRSGNSRHDVTCRCRTCCLTSWNSALSAFILAIFSLCVLISLSYESCSLSVLPNQKSNQSIIPNWKKPVTKSFSRRTTMSNLGLDVCDVRSDEIRRLTSPISLRM